MSDCICLTTQERSTLLRYYRNPENPALRQRAHIILLLADRHPWATIATMLFCSTAPIDRWQKRFRTGRLPALVGQPPGPRPRWGSQGVAVVVGWVTQQLPTDFGFLRSRWCCQVVVLLLLEIHGVAVSRETVRRWLHRGQLVWRRPRPTLGPRDPERATILRRLRRSLAHLPDDET